MLIIEPTTEAVTSEGVAFREGGSIGVTSGIGDEKCVIEIRSDDTPTYSDIGQVLDSENLAYQVPEFINLRVIKPASATAFGVYVTRHIKSDIQ